MVFKFVASVALLAVAQAGFIQSPYAAPVHYAPQQLVAKVAAPYALKQVEAEHYDSHPQYSYGYEVQDGATGDSKSQQETRDGDSVQGSYSLIDADGYKRTVHYTADSVHGFNAVVQREPLAHKAVVAKAVAAPVAYASPAVAHAAPLAYSAPVGYSGHAYSAPVAYSSHAAPLGYAAPLPKVAYSAPVSYASAPVVAKSYSAPVAYSAYHH